MYEPKLIESSEEYDVWECGGKKLVHKKRYSRTLKRYSSGTYRLMMTSMYQCQIVGNLCILLMVYNILLMNILVLKIGVYG